MSIRDDILAVMRATGKPLQAREIASAICRNGHSNAVYKADRGSM